MHLSGPGAFVLAFHDFAGSVRGMYPEKQTWPCMAIWIVLEYGYRAIAGFSWV